ncbi:MBL fold metallo-hydrolase [Caballeronia sp. dw_19]|uniref:MBL fold metallo-hydrolase n=1 Tax=unclassified Caballeronia TaxID=2646786 RepID=UPI001BD1D8E6|nr:MBL fold metallo-hydrolase [Caballeronia sp. dw_19]
MNVQKIGNVAIHKVDEIARMALEAKWLFPSIDEELVAAHRHTLGPLLVEPGSTRLYMSFHSYVIRTRHHTILVDACNGNHKQRPSMPAWNDLDTPYLANLAAIGVRPEDIDIVLCTHLHADHVGWNTRLQNGKWVPTFPNARYLMARVEYEHLLKQKHADPHTPVNRGSFDDSVLPVVEHGRADMVELDHMVERELGENIWLSPACGHTPGHVFVNVGEHGRERAVFTGDVIHHPIQFIDTSVANLADFNPQQARDTRLGLMRRYADTDTLVMTGHFPSPTAGRIVSHGDQFRFAFKED